MSSDLLIVGPGVCAVSYPERDNDLGSARDPAFELCRTVASSRRARELCWEALARGPPGQPSRRANNFRDQSREVFTPNTPLTEWNATHPIRCHCDAIHLTHKRIACSLPG